MSIGFLLEEAAEYIASHLASRPEPSHTAGEDTKHAAALQSNLTVLYKTKHKSTFDPSVAPLSCNPKNESLWSTERLVHECS